MTDALALQERKDAELSLLFAMYPDQLQWQDTRQELAYRSAYGALVLRVSSDYLLNSSPTIVSASGIRKQDLRDETIAAVKCLELPVGEEVLDAILQAFDGVAAHEATKQDGKEQAQSQSVASDDAQSCYKTVVVWLHHLLNTSKRKLALSPSIASDQIVGVTKPGYPGVLVYSGNYEAIDAHLSELKAERWQAFQVRLDETADAPWRFTHGTGIVEVETMGDIAQTICDHYKREEFLKAIGVK